MKVPSSPRKRYLSGADWCVAALQEGTLEHTGRPFRFFVAVFVEGRPSAELLKTHFQNYCAQFPLLWGTTARCWCLAPYWKIPPPGATRVAPFREVTGLESVSPETLAPWVEARANEPPVRSECAVTLSALMGADGSSALVFSFNHLLFDAAGSERWIQLFFDFADGRVQQGDFPQADAPAPAQLDQWCKRFAGGQKLNRAMRELMKGETAHLPLPAQAQQCSFRMRVLTLGAGEVRRVQEQAFATAGYLMLTPFVLATAAAVFLPRFLSRTPPQSNFVVSVSTRRAQSPNTTTPHLFFNDLSFLYFGFSMAQARNRDELARMLRDQMIAQVKAQMPDAIEDANLLMRILPARLFWKFLTKFFNNRIGSFAMTCLNESYMQAGSVLGCAIRTHVHFPVIPTPPGLGLILNRSGQELHLVLSYLEGILPEEEIETILADYRARLLNEELLLP